MFKKTFKLKLCCYNLERNVDIEHFSGGSGGFGDGKVPTVEHQPGEGKSLADRRLLQRPVLYGHSTGAGEKESVILVFIS